MTAFFVSGMDQKADAEPAAPSPKVINPVRREGKHVRRAENFTHQTSPTYTMLFATSFSLFFRKVISLPYSFSGFFLGRPLLVSFLSIVCLFSIL